MQHTVPKQCKLLGATVAGFGLVVAVSSTLSYGYAIVESADWVNHRVRLADLRREDVTFPLTTQAYTTGTQRVGYGTWDEVYSLIPSQSSVLEVAA